MHNNASVGFFLPCIEERESLVQTLTILNSFNLEKSSYYIVTDCEASASSLLSFLQDRGLRDKAVVLVQSEPKLSGALKKAIQICREDFFILMASDLETDPTQAGLLLSTAIANPGKIVCVSRWSSWRNFNDYGWLRLVANFIFQFLFRIRFGFPVTDATFGYRCYPTSLIKSLELKASGHAILFEALVLPLLTGAEIIEIPGRWTARSEGFSKKDWKNNLSYLKILLCGP